MTKSASTSKKPRKQHTPEFCQEALKLAERIGVAAAARAFNLYGSQRYTCAVSINNARCSSEREQEMSVEIARLKRQLTERDEEAGYSPKGRDILREVPEMTSVFIEKHQAAFSIKARCRVLRVARSGGYAWR